MNSNADPLDNLDDAQAAAAFRRLVRHLRHRHDAQNIELMGLAGVVIAGLIARAVRHRPSGGFSSPGTGQRTEVRTAFLQAWIDHATGDVGGHRVHGGRFRMGKVICPGEGVMILIS